jgi:hypothetical protein
MDGSDHQGESFMKASLHLGCLALGIANSLLAYNLEGHGEMTRIAFNKSILTNDPQLLFRLGLDRLDQNRPFRNLSTSPCNNSDIQSLYAADAYIDAVASWLTPAQPNVLLNQFARCPTLYEQRSMPPNYTGLIASPPAAIGPTGNLRIEGWLMRGVIREDDFRSGTYDDPNLTPDRDPWNDGFRSINHFYDPVRGNSGLGPTGNVGQRSPTWALGIADSANWQTDQTPDPARGNHFSYMDARKQFFLALTHKDPPGISRGALSEYQLRTNLWATTFKSLGHIVHLLQDTASPQHARAEPHSFLCNGNLIDDLPQATVATRTYENFSNYRVTARFNAAPGVQASYSASSQCEDEKWRGMFDAGGQSLPTPLLAWEASNTYPIPQFSVQRKFFTTRLEDTNINARRGLADYSNRGFFTEGAFEQRYGNPDPTLTSPPPLNDASYVEGTTQNSFVPGLGNVETQSLFWRVPDAVAPNYADPNLDASQRAPVVSRSMWSGEDLMGVPVDQLGGNLTLENYTQISDMLPPRAIAYSAGMIDFFFRGKLEIEPIQQRIFGVMNAGNPHTVDADGYPRDANGKIFGFEKIRLKVRNLTDPIIESGTNQNVPQTVGAGTLVAVARYHRNACYKPDLSGERQQRLSTPPALLIDEPLCASGLPSRTDYQEISVSAPLTINSSTDLPGGNGGAPPASIEKIFDFSADPIPVNATDLLIQVVYRGQLGEETDGIAVGMIDTQEPTFLAAWNNSDYYWSDLGNNWLVANSLSFPARGVDQINICAGSPSVLVFRYLTTDGTGGLQFFNPPLTPGVARLAFINLKQPTASNMTPYRVTPQMLPPPSAGQRLISSRGQQRQATKEIYSAADPLPAPRFCQANPPMAGENVWCVDPIQKRRGQGMGDAFTPIYYNSQGGSGGSDVDAGASPHTPFPGLRPRAGGTVRFDTDTTLTPCPAIPTSPEEMQRIELLEAAISAGMDPKDLRLDD